MTLPNAGRNAGKIGDGPHLKAILSRFAAGTADAAEHQRLSQAVLNGTIAFAAGNRSVSVAEATHAVIMTGDVHVDVELGPRFAETFLQLVRPQKPGRYPAWPELTIGRSVVLAEVKRRIGVRDDANPAGRLVIEGWPGIGKTTLTGALAYDSEVGVAFPDGVLWTSLGQTPSVLAELGAWGNALGLRGLVQSATVSDAVSRLRDLLRGRRVLILVDDVWDAAHAQPFLRAAGPHGAVVVTTRLSSVASALDGGSEQIYRLPGLKEEDGIRLLTLLAPRVVRANEAACRMLVRDLECSPLAIQVAGRLLEAEMRLGWPVEELLKRIRTGAAVIEAVAPADRTDLEQQTRPIVAALLSLSTDILSPETRRRFAILGAFAPKPAAFDLQALSAVWDLHDARPVVRELADAGLLQPAGGQFQVHALMVAHARALLTEYDASGSRR